MTELKNCTTNFFPELCGVNVVVDPQGVTSNDDDRVVIIGQKSDTGLAADFSLQKVTDSTRGLLFGINSVLDGQITDFLEVAPTAEVWAYVLPNTGTAANSTITVTGVDTATTTGVVYVWVNGRTYQASFDPSIDDNDSLAVKIQSVISATDSTLLVTVTNNVIEIDTLNKGVVGGFLDVRTSYSRRPDQISSPEITLSVNTTDATGFPNLTSFASLTDGFEFVVNPYTDDDSINAVSSYLCSQWSGGVNSRAYGVFYGDTTQAGTFGNNANNALLAYPAVNKALTPGYLESSSFSALSYNQLNSQSVNIAASMTGQAMPAMLAPEQSDVFTNAEKALLVEKGMGYFNVNRVNDVIIGRAVTTFTVRDNGTLDYSLRDINKPALIAVINSFFQDRLSAKYTGYAFRRDGITGNSSNQKVATLPAIRNYVITLGQELSNLGLIQNLEGFIDSIELTINNEGCVVLTVSPECVDTFCCMVVNLQTI